jgi:uncharacterized protein YbjQ (UPF0145 family)
LSFVCGLSRNDVSSTAFDNFVQALPGVKAGETSVAETVRSSTPNDEFFMQVSFTGSLQAGRAAKTIGRIKVVGRWRGVDEPATESDRRALLRDLTREAEDYGADALIDVRFEAEETAESDGVSLRRLVASGSAVQTALAA